LMVIVAIVAQHKLGTDCEILLTPDTLRQRIKFRTNFVDSKQLLLKF